MTDQSQATTSGLLDFLTLSIEQTGQLHAVLERTIQALNKRGVQILIDFNNMTRDLRQNIEQAQKDSQFLSRQLDQFQELVNTSALLTSSLELEEVLKEVMDTVIKLTGAERAFLMLHQPDTNELKVQAARDWSHESISEDDFTFSHGIIQTALEQGTPLITTNAQDDSRFAEMKSVFSHDLRSAVVIPMILQGKTVGVLYVDNRIEQGVFTQENVPLLGAFANQAAIAISNARLFEKVKDDLAEAQREVMRLQIEINHEQLQDQVSEIVDSDYFQKVSERAKKIRKSDDEEK